MPAKDELVSEFRSTLKHCLNVLETAMGDPAQLAELKALVPKLNFTGRDSDGLPGPSREEYMEPLLNAYYFTRYGLAYAFEYSVIYDAIMRDIAQSDVPPVTNVAAFGCGSMIDAWSLAYAKKKLEEAGVTNMDSLSLSYHGFDGAKWDVYFAGDKAVEYDANGDPTGSYSKVNECFTVRDVSGGMVMKMPWINGFSATGEGVDIAGVFTDPGYRDAIGDCNVLFFPKILNELGENTLGDVISGIRDMAQTGCFKQKEIYIAISHSYSDLEKGHALNYAKRIYEAFNCNNEYNVSGTVFQRSPFYPHQFGLRKIDISPSVNSDKELYKFYEFYKAEGDYGPYSSPVDVFDKAFGGQLKDEISEFDDARIGNHDIPGYKRMISRATYIAMQVIKLTKR